MSNYYGAGRTNTFTVKDVAALKAALEPHDFTVLDRGNNQVSIFADDDDGVGDWTHWVDVGDGDDVELYVPDMITAHLQDGQVAVFQHVGNEKQRYLTGYSVAVHSDGRMLALNLDDIIAKAEAEWGVSEIEPVSY